MNDIVGSKWGVWDLQIQTILDSGYKELKDYFHELKTASPDKWSKFTALVGSEEDAILFDSKQYFNQSNPSTKHRCDNYSKTLFSFLKVFAPELKCIGVTDHNHIHDELMDSLVRTSKDFECKVLPGVEVNVDGIHILVYFPKPPCDKSTYSEGIKAFLATLGVFNIKSDGVYCLAQGGVKKVIDEIKKQHGMFIFAHCNSDNGLFQERGKTDRTHLAEIFNHSSPVFLQTHSKNKADELAAYIRTKPNLKSSFVLTIASDGRSLKEYGKSDPAGNYCFIKGLETVEGLRQAGYEPETRVRLGNASPISPIHRIDNIKLTFPDGVKLNDDVFCLAGDHDVRFSPNYTCLIGGRGTGKSTLLNLLQEKIQPKANAFFASKKITSSDGKVISISEYIKIDEDIDKKTIDFLSQNEIEKFATTPHALTSALYSRLEKENQGKLKKAQEQLAIGLSDFQSYIDYFKKKSDFENRIIDLEKERQSFEKVLQSFQSDQYKQLSSLVADHSEKLRYFQGSKQKFNKLQSEIEKLIPENLEVSEGSSHSSEKNEYDLAFEKVVALLQQARGQIQSLNKEDLLRKENGLEGTLQEMKIRLSEYLAEKGLKPESQQDVTEANENISRLKGEIEDTREQLIKVVKNLHDYSPSKLEESKLVYETILYEQIRTVNLRLENLSAQVKTIKLEYKFDNESAKRSIFEAAKKMFDLIPSEIGTKENALFEAMFCVEPMEINLKESFVEAIEQRPKGRDLSKAQAALVELFQIEKNFDLFKLLIKKYFSDPSTFKIVNVYYDGKLLPDSSFGQRCTAALVLLLLLGNNPIIIDEPEGHLDSLLIANYLVELIKKTKEHRQIIFATHNANLVVNGDADLIYHLEMTDQKKSKITPVFLEDVEQRHRIISLEGGHDAFQKRENKYRKQAV